MNAWGEATPAPPRRGSPCWPMPTCTFTEAIGMRFDAPPAGLIGRSLRYAMLVEDGVVKVLNLEENPGQCLSCRPVRACWTPCAE